jgi:long-chain fatty acid transport protein
MKPARVVVAIAALLSAAPAHATNGMRMIGFGASQVSVGGVSAALPLDAASVITNPAGITELGGRLDFGASYFKPSVSYHAQEVPGLPQPGMAVASTATFDSQRGASPVPAFGLVLPLGDGLAFGIGAYGIAGMGVDYAQNLYGGVTYSSYSQMRFAPGFAWKISDLISVGATLNLMYADMGYFAAEGLMQVPHPNSSAFGIGGTVGVRVTPLPFLAFGAAYETKSWFQDFHYNVPAHQPIDPTTGRPATNPDGSPIVLPAGQDTIQFNQPDVVTVGVAVKPLDALTVAADVEWIHWTTSNGQNYPLYTSDVATTGAMPWNLNWSDQWVFKVGAQYRVIDPLVLRAGYNYGKSPLDPSRAFENIAFPAIAEHHITFGAGWDITRQVGLNLAAMFVPQATLSGSNPQQQYIASYTTTMSQFALDLALAYRF